MIYQAGDVVRAKVELWGDDDELVLPRQRGVIVMQSTHEPDYYEVEFSNTKIFANKNCFEYAGHPYTSIFKKS